MGEFMLVLQRKSLRLKWLSKVLSPVKFLVPMPLVGSFSAGMLFIGRDFTSGRCASCFWMLSLEMERSLTRGESRMTQATNSCIPTRLLAPH